MRLQEMESERAAEAYRLGGKAELEKFGRRLEQALGGRQYFTDKSGRDLLTGEMHPEAAGELVSGEVPRMPPNRVLKHTSEAPDGSLRMVWEMPRPVPPGGFWPFWGIEVLAIALFCWPLASNLAGPVRRLSLRVDCFGQGDLSVRMGSTRRDEIGDLERSFDRMADRIETLLTAERRLLQDVSHELRSPLARLSFAAELARTGADREGAARQLKRDIQRLSTLVGTLLDMTRAEGDPASWETKGVALDELLQEVVADCRIEAEAAGSAIRVLGIEEAEVQGDPELLRRATENVIRNAVQYSGVRGNVDVLLTNTKGEVKLRVRDSGPGVPDELLMRIFQPFFRVDDARSDHTGGTGLGLAIVQRAVMVHHGTVRAWNAEPGLCVEIVLPAV